MDEQKMKILSIGAGAIGTYIGGSLALSDHQVVFLEHPDAVAPLKQGGMHLNLHGEERSVKDLRVTGSVEEALEQSPFDFAIFALKSYDTQSALEGLKDYAHRLPPFLCLQNGVDNEPAISEALGEGKVIYGTVTSAIGRRGVGNIILERLRGVGVAEGHPLSARITTALKEAGLNGELFQGAADMKWSKMLTNLISNPTSAILDMTAAEVFANKALFKLEMQQLQEALAVMKAQGIKVVDLPGTPVRALAIGAKLPTFLSQPLMVNAVAKGRGEKMPSFHIDLHSGRGKSEVTYLHGAVVRAGERYGIPTPVNKALTETLMAITKGEEDHAKYRHNPEALISKL